MHACVMLCACTTLISSVNGFAATACSDSKTICIKVFYICHCDFGPREIGPGGPKSPRNSQGVWSARTKSPSDYGPSPDILVRS